MKLSRFSNDEYKLLNYMKSIEINYKQTKIIIDSQIEISKNIHFSLAKTNQIIKALINLNLISKYSEHGKNYITEKGNEVIRYMEKEIF